MERYFYFEEANGARFLSVRDDVILFRFLNASLGKVESQVSQQPFSESEIATDINLLFKHGYQEVSQADFAVVQNSIEQKLRDSTMERIDSRAELMDWKQLAAMHQHYFQNDPAEYLDAHLQSFCYFKDRLRMSEDLDIGFNSMGPTVQSSRRNLVFDCGLEIDGILDAGDLTTELPLFILVKGDLKANHLLLSGWAELVVTGNVHVSGCVVGIDGESGGRLKVHGNLSASKILGGYAYDMEIDGNVDADVFWLDNDESPFPSAIAVPEELSSEEHKLLSAKMPLSEAAYSISRNWAIGKEVTTYHFDACQSFDILRRGEKLFR